MGARAAPGREWRLAEAVVQKRVQSRAYAPPQRPPTRSPPITRDTNITVPAAHTLTRVGGAKPPRHGRQPPHSEDGQRSPPLWRLSPSYLHQHLARRCPGTAAIRKRPTTRRHAWGSSGDGGSEALLQEIWRRPQRCMNKFAISSLLGASATGLPRFADVLRTCTMMVQEIVTMIVTMGLRVKAQTPAAQRMTRKSS